MPQLPPRRKSSRPLLWCAWLLLFFMAACSQTPAPAPQERAPLEAQGSKDSVRTSDIVQIARTSDVEVDPELLNQLQSDPSVGFLMYFRESPDLSAAQTMDWEARGHYVMNTLQKAAASSQADVRAYLDSQRVPYEAFWIDNIIVVERSSADVVVSLLRSFPEVRTLAARQEIILYEPVETTASESFSTSPQNVAIPNLVRVKATDVWALGFRGTGITVASIDTGVRHTHQALVGPYRGNLGGGTFDHNYNWWNPYAASTVPSDSNDHGSHVTGTMVGSVNDGNPNNQIGMAPDAKWIACMGFNPSATDAGLLGCAQFLTAPTNLAGQSPDPSRRAHVVNNSWGSCGRSYDPWYQGVVNAWHAAGVYPVFSNGNNSNCSYAAPPGLNTVGVPARYGNVTGVGSTSNSTGIYANHSNWGPTDNLDPDETEFRNLKPLVMAPGVQIRSAVRANDTAYSNFTGTSMSSPHFAGLVALMWDAAPCLIGDYVTTKRITAQTAIRIPYATNHGTEGPGNIPNHATGWGEIDALAAVQEAQQECGPSGIIEGVVSDSSGNPVSGVLLTFSSAESTRTTLTNASGQYSRNVAVGAYEVTASKFGYRPTTLSGVNVSEDSTVLLNISLPSADRYTVSGTLTDATTGWTLHGSIAISGAESSTLWTDPQTGAYSVELVEGATYTFTVNAWVNGYLPATRTVGPLSGNATENFALNVNSTQCNAPGYSPSGGLIEGFNATTLPSGWSNVDNIGNGQVWRFDNHGNAGNLTGGTGGFAIINSDAYGSGGSQDTELRTPSLDFSAQSTVMLDFRYDWRNWSGSLVEVGDVDVSNDGGSTWTNVWRRTGSAADRGPKIANIDISALAGNQANVMVRFRYYNASFEYWWQVDDVRVGVQCLPSAGSGLVQGYVYDANTNAPLTGASVTVIGSTATGEPVVMSINDGLYTINAPAGTQTISASRSGYSAVNHSVDVVADSNVWQDFYLPAAVLSVSPSSLSAHVLSGGSSTLPLNLANNGGAAATYDVHELNVSFNPAGTEESSLSVTGSETSRSDMLDGGSTVIAGASRHEISSADPIWQSLPALPEPVSRPGGTFVGGKFYVIGGEATGGAILGRVQVYDPASNLWSNTLPTMPVPSSNTCVAAVGSDIYAIGGSDIASNTLTNVQVFNTLSSTWSTVTSDPLPVAAIGVVCAAHAGRLYVFGGQNSAGGYLATARVYDPAAAEGSRWSNLANVPATLAFGGAVSVNNLIYVAGVRNTTADLATVRAYNPATNTWALLPNLQTARGGAGVWAVGTTLYVGGGGWTTFRSTVERYDTTLGTSGTWSFAPALVQARRTFAYASTSGRLYAAGGWAGAFLGNAEALNIFSDVPWLSVSPTSGSVAANSTSGLTVSFDATGLADGVYQAEIHIINNSPYGNLVVPVTFTVGTGEASLTWTAVEPVTVLASPNAEAVVMAMSAQAGAVSPAVTLDALALEVETLNSLGGSGNTLAGVSEMKLYRDVNGDGALDGGDSLLASSSTLDAEGRIAFSLDTPVVISAGETVHFLVTFVFEGN